MKSKGNVAVFVPHEGCPNQCSFCNQRSITAVSAPPSIEDVHNTCIEAEKYNKDRNIDCELAFFGGSFTAINREYMLSLLEVVKPFVDKGTFTGIRISTRPDKIDSDILKLLKEYGVSAIELGCQSMDDEVLLANNRGHSRSDIIMAAQLIKKFGFSLGVQMMTGLYKDNHKKCKQTAQDLISLKPDTVRIYPTVVLPDTDLARLYSNGKYNPPNAIESVPLVADLMEMFLANDIKIIRVGLHAEVNVERQMLAGGYHPGFKELCESHILLKKVLKIVNEKAVPHGDILIEVPKGCISKMIGHKHLNTIALEILKYKAKIVENPKLSGYEVNISKI